MREVQRLDQRSRGVEAIVQESSPLLSSENYKPVTASERIDDLRACFLRYPLFMIPHVETVPQGRSRGAVAREGIGVQPKGVD